MHVRSRRSAGPHAIRNRVVAFPLAFVQNNQTAGLFANSNLHLGVCMYAQVPQHFAISLIFRATVDKKENSVEVLPIGPCIYRIFLSCPSTVWIRSIG